MLFLRLTCVCPVRLRISLFYSGLKNLSRRENYPVAKIILSSSPFLFRLKLIPEMGFTNKTSAPMTFLTQNCCQGMLQACLSEVETALGKLLCPLGAGGFKNKGPRRSPRPLFSDQPQHEPSKRSVTTALNREEPVKERAITTQGSAQFLCRHHATKIQLFSCAHSGVRHNFEKKIATCSRIWDTQIAY
jgi:hypothetical protein